MNAALTPTSGQTHEPAPHVAVLTALLVLAASLLASAPALGPLDAGDLATASMTLGVPHATGYPLEVMLGRVFAWLPLANAAARIAFTSAVASAVAAYFAVEFVRRAFARSAPWPLGAAVAAIFVTAPTLALHARIPEVYALSLFCLFASLFALIRLRETHDLRWVALGGLAIGLGVVNHALFRLFAIPLVVVALALVPSASRWRAASLGVGFGSLAQLAWLYLPAAALGRSLHNWGDPSSPGRLWAHINGSYIREAFADEMGISPWHIWYHLQRVGSQVFDAMGFAALLVPIGLLVMWMRARVLGSLLIVLCVIDVGYSVVINPMGLRDWQNLQVSLLCFAVSVGVAGSAALELFARWSKSAGVNERLVIVAGTACVIALFATAGVPEQARVGRDSAFDDLVAIHAATALPGSITTVTSDSVSASVLWHQLALDARPDSVLVGRYLFGFPSEAIEVLEQAPFDAIGALRAGPLPERAQGLGAFVLTLLTAAGEDRAVYWEVDATRSDLPAGTPYAHRWPLGRVNVDAASECADPRWSFCAGIDGAFAAAARAEAGQSGLWYRRWFGAQLSRRGAIAFRANQFGEAAELYQLAIATDPGSAGARTSLSAALASSGDLAGALAEVAAALEINPASLVTLRNGIAFAEAAGETELAAQYRARLERLEPDSRR